MPVDFNEPVAEIGAVEEVFFAPEIIRPPFPEIAMKLLPPFIPAGEIDPLSTMVMKPEDDFFPKPIAEPWPNIIAIPEWNSPPACPVAISEPFPDIAGAENPLFFPDAVREPFPAIIIPA